MDRKPITAAVVEAADRLLAFGIDYATIAARLGITEYVVSVMAGDELRVGRPQPRDSYKRHIHNRQNTVDTTTVCMVQRMLAVGQLNRREIAREAGVSGNLVSQIAKGKRPAVTTTRVPLEEGERFLPERIRCSVCGAKNFIVPCRACKSRRQKKYSGRM